MLRIRNISKIEGRLIESKWLPNTKGWWVNRVEEIKDAYIFELLNSDRNIVWNKAEITLDKQPLLSPETFDTLYLMWAMNYETGLRETKSCKLYNLNTVEETGLELAMILDKIIPSN